MSEELIDGWYWVQWNTWNVETQSTIHGPWRVVYYDAPNTEWAGHRGEPAIIGPRILTPDELTAQATRLEATEAECVRLREAIAVALDMAARTSIHSNPMKYIHANKEIGDLLHTALAPVPASGEPEDECRRHRHDKDGTCLAALTSGSPPVADEDCGCGLGGECPMLPHERPAMTPAQAAQEGRES